MRHLSLNFQEEFAEFRNDTKLKTCKKIVNIVGALYEDELTDISYRNFLIICNPILTRNGLFDHGKYKSKTAFSP